MTGAACGPDTFGPSDGRTWQDSTRVGGHRGLVGAGLALGAIISVLVVLSAGTAIDVTLAATITAIDTGTVTAAALLAAFGLHMAHTTSDRRYRWFGVATGAIAVAAMAERLPPGQWDVDGPHAAIRTGATLVAVVALAVACRAPRTGRRNDVGQPAGVLRSTGNGRSIGLGLLSVAVAAAVVLALSRTFDPVQVGVVTSTLAGAGAAGLAVAAIVTSIARDQRTVAWFGLLLAGLAASELTMALWYGDTGSWHFSASAARLLACLITAVGVFATVGSTVAEQRSALRSIEERQRRSTARLHIEQQDRRHEATNALAAIEAATSVMGRGRERLSANQARRLGDGVSQEIRRLQRLLHDDGPVSRRTVEFDVRDVLAEQVALASCRGALVSVDAAAEAMPIEGDETEVAEVVQNLLVNAARHGASPHGTTVHASCDATTGCVTIRVEDRGPGIPMAERQHIFIRGVRGSTQTAGSGVGLAICRRLARSWGGDVWAEHRRGGGTRFVVTLPRRTVTAPWRTEVHHLGGGPVTAAPPKPASA